MSQKSDRNCCQNCSAEEQSEFQKIIDLKPHGLAVYRYITHPQTSQSSCNDGNAGSSFRNIESNDIVILHNTRNNAISTAQYVHTFATATATYDEGKHREETCMPMKRRVKSANPHWLLLIDLELRGKEQCDSKGKNPILNHSTQINCLRCRQVVQRAQRLLRNVDTISKKGVKGVCDHCLAQQARRQFRRSCFKCQDIIKKFTASKGITQDTQDPFKKKIFESKLRSPSELIMEKNTQRPSLPTKRDLKIEQLFQESEQKFEKQYSSWANVSESNLQRITNLDIETEYKQKDVKFEAVPKIIEADKHIFLEKIASMDDKKLAALITYVINGLKELEKESVTQALLDGKSDSEIEDLVLQTILSEAIDSELAVQVLQLANACEVFNLPYLGMQMLEKPSHSKILQQKDKPKKLDTALLGHEGEQAPEKWQKAEAFQKREYGSLELLLQQKAMKEQAKIRTEARNVATLIQKKINEQKRKSLTILEIIRQKLPRKTKEPVGEQEGALQSLIVDKKTRDLESFIRRKLERGRKDDLEYKKDLQPITHKLFRQKLSPTSKTNIDSGEESDHIITITSISKELIPIRKKTGEEDNTKHIYKLDPLHATSQFHYEYFKEPEIIKTPGQIISSSILMNDIIQKQKMNIKDKERKLVIAKKGFIHDKSKKDTTKENTFAETEKYLRKKKDRTVELKKELDEKHLEKKDKYNENKLDKLKKTVSMKGHKNKERDRSLAKTSSVKQKKEKQKTEKQKRDSETSQTEIETDEQKAERELRQQEKIEKRKLEEEEKENEAIRLRAEQEEQEEQEIERQKAFKAKEAIIKQLQAKHLKSMKKQRDKLPLNEADQEVENQSMGKRSNEVIIKQLNKCLINQEKEKKKLMKRKEKLQKKENKFRSEADKLAARYQRSFDKLPNIIASNKPYKNMQTKKTKKTKTGEEYLQLPFKSFRIKNPSFDNLISNLVKIKQRKSVKKGDDAEVSILKAILKKANDKQKLISGTNTDSDLDSDFLFDVESLLREKSEECGDIIIGNQLLDPTEAANYISLKEMEPGPKPTMFKSEFKEAEPEETDANIVNLSVQLKPTRTQPSKQDGHSGVIRYSLSNKTYIDNGWTQLPTQKIIRKMNVYRMRPAHPEFDWFEHNKKKGYLYYDTGELLASIDSSGHGRWYYRNGRIALDYYDAKEINAKQRIVVYSDGKSDEKGILRPVTVLGSFDYCGNGVILDSSGKVRLKYNQTEGMVLDPKIGPASHWQWHNLNDPPQLKHIFTDLKEKHKNSVIQKLCQEYENTEPVIEPDAERTAIELDNSIKERFHTLKKCQSFKPFPIRMKALKINTQFSLRVLDQANVYIMFKDGSTNLKLNLGMILDPFEIVDIDIIDLSKPEFKSHLEKFPAVTTSIDELQDKIATAKSTERARIHRDQWLRPKITRASSADKFVNILSRPLRPIAPLPICSLPCSPCNRI